jgi:hypothetical protein
MARRPEITNAVTGFGAKIKRPKTPFLKGGTTMAKITDTSASSPTTAPNTSTRTRRRSLTSVSRR